MLIGMSSFAITGREHALNNMENTGKTSTLFCLMTKPSFQCNITVMNIFMIRDAS